MFQLHNILVPTDLSDQSRRALQYGCGLATEEKATLIVLHVASEMDAWEFYSEEALYAGVNSDRPWPLDRIVCEATLDLNRFLGPQLAELTQPARVTQRVVLGQVAQQIIYVAEEEKVDLIIMSPRRDRGLRHWLYGSVTDRVTRLSPCPVLSITPPLPSQPWRGKVTPPLLGWPRRRTATL